MGDMTGLVVVGALVIGGFLFKDQIIAMLPQPGGDAGAGAGGAAAGGDAGAGAQQPAAPATNTTIIAPTPIGVGYPVLGGYPYGYAPYGGYPWAWPPVIGHFSAPRWFNNYPRFPYGGYPYPRPGPRFLGPPVPAPFPHH